MSVEIVHASCLDLPTVAADVGAACMFVDPPYSPRVHSKATSAGTGGRGVRKRDFGFGHLTPELMLQIARYAQQVQRWSLIFTDLESVAAWRAALVGVGAEYVRTVPWVRWSQPQLSGDRPPSGCEAVVIAHRAGPKGKPIRKRWNGPGNLTAFGAASLRGADKHPTEKPLDLMLQIVSWFSDPGETVFDPCAGRGTTCLAAALLGRSALGLEVDGDETKRAADRLRWNAAAGRDGERLRRFLEGQVTEAAAVPAPRAKNGSDVKTWERAQRRIKDAVEAAERAGIE